MVDTADIDVLRAMIIDQFDRVAELVHSLTDDLPPEVARWRPDPDGNSVAWLLWHLTRVQDDHVAGLAGTEQVWTEQGFYERFALPFPPEAHGFGHSSDDVAAVQTSAALIDEYQTAVHARCVSWAAALTADDLARVVDTNWDPPVTAATRLVSLIGDGLQHAGQAAYIRGMARRAGIGSSRRGAY